MAGSGRHALLRWPDIGDRGGIGATIARRVRTPVAQSMPLPGDPGWETSELFARAVRSIELIVSSRIGGECWKPDPQKLPEHFPSGDYSLVVGTMPQFAKDGRSVARRMIEAANAGGDAPVVFVPPHNALARTWFSRNRDTRKWHVLAGPLSPWTLLDGARCIYTMDAEFALLARLKGTEVHSFGPSFGVEWSTVRDDRCLSGRPFGMRTVELFAADALLGTEYTNPFTGAPATLEEACQILAAWKRQNEINRTIAVCVGMSFWKRRRIAQFLRSTDGRPAFARNVPAAVRRAKKRNGKIAVWGSRESPELATVAAKSGVGIIRVEDGFLRSVGLGADFIPGASIVVDRSGIYYDPNLPSDLEQILSDAHFDAASRDRANALIDRLVARGITKYNVGASRTPLIEDTKRNRIFVPGQVEDDRSVVCGTAFDIRGNLDLLRAVRERNPEAFILYKPHPDVDAGHRAGAIADKEARRYANMVVRRVSSAAIFEDVDEVHTLTSLAGFEALMRRRKVVVYGRPFYAGWGLTTDVSPQRSRARQLRLDELVAGTLIFYPRYLDPVSGLPCTPEILVHRLEDSSLWRNGVVTDARRLQGLVMRHFREIVGRAARAEVA